MDNTNNKYNVNILPTITVTDLQRKPNSCFDLIQEKGIVKITKYNKPFLVAMTFDLYTKLMDTIEGKNEKHSKI